MKRPYQITSIVFIVFSAFVIRESLELQFYTPIGPGAGFFPFWLAFILGSLAAILFYQATFCQTDPMPENFFAPRTGYMRIGSITLALLVSVISMDPIGFRLTTLAFLLFLLLVLGRQNLVVTLVVALAGSFGVYELFVAWLRVPLPVGMLGI